MDNLQQNIEEMENLNIDEFLNNIDNENNNNQPQPKPQAQPQPAKQPKGKASEMPQPAKQPKAEKEPTSEQMANRTEEIRIRDMLLSVKEGQPNYKSMQVAVFLSSGMTLYEALEENVKKEEKEKLLEQMKPGLKGDGALDYYSKVMIKAYGPLMAGLHRYKHELTGLDDDHRKSKKTLDSVNAVSNLLEMYNGDKENERLEKFNVQAGISQNKVNYVDVLSNTAFFVGYKQAIKSTYRKPVNLFGVDLEELGVTDLKAELDANMKKGSNNDKSLRMQRALDEFITSFNDAKKPYTRDQLLKIDKSLRILHNATKAYCDYKTAENPQKGAGKERLYIANRLLGVVDNIAGRVDPYMAEELADAISLKNVKPKKVTRYVAVDKAEFDKMTFANDNAKDRSIAKGAYAQYRDELAKIAEKNPGDEALNEFIKKVNRLVDSEKTYEEVPRRDRQAKFEKAKEKIGSEVDKYLEELYAADISKKNDEKITLVEKIKGSLVESRAMVKIRLAIKEQDEFAKEYDKKREYTIEALKKLDMPINEGSVIPEEYAKYLDGVANVAVNKEPRVLCTNAIAYERFKSGDKADESFKNYKDPEYIAKAIKDYGEFCKNNPVFSDVRKVKPYMDDKLKGNLKAQAEFNKNWAKSLFDTTFVAFDGEHHKEALDKYLTFNDEIIGFEKNESDFEYFGDDYYLHFGSVEEHLKMRNKFEVAKLVGATAQNYANPNRPYFERVLNGLILEDLSKKFEGKSLSELSDIEQKDAYGLAMISITISECLKNNNAACERYINGCATEKDKAELKKMYEKAKVAKLNETTKSYDEIVNRYLNLQNERRIEARLADMVDAKIKMIEFDKAKLGGEDYRNKLVDHLKTTKSRGALIQQMKKNIDVNSFTENLNKKLSDKEFNDMANEQVTKAGLPKYVPSDSIKNTAKQIEEEQRKAANNNAAVPNA